MTSPHRDEVEAVLAASAVITDPDGRVLLVRRGHAPQRGRWSVPGGRVEPGERLEEAAAREALEETGIRVTVGEELWTVRVPAGDGRQYEIHGFAGTPVGGALAHGDDATDARWVSPADLHGLRTTIHLVDHLRRTGIVEPLPHVDEHAISIAADPAAVRAAVEEGIEVAGLGWFARLLACEDLVSSGPRPLAEWSAVPGFHVTAADRPTRLVLAGRHRFSDYELHFGIEALGGGASRLRAETRALFPGRRGAVYRFLLLRTGLHARATRAVLGRVKRIAEAPRRA